MNIAFKYAAPSETDAAALWYYSNEVIIILDNLTHDLDYIDKKISDLYLQEYLCASCNPENYECKKEWCPYEGVIDSIECEVWS